MGTDKKSTQGRAGVPGRGSKRSPTAATAGAKRKAAAVTTRKIVLATRQGHPLLRVEAAIVGPFGVHPNVGGSFDERDQFTVTHVQSGYRVVDTTTRAKALRVARALAQKTPAKAWRFTDPTEAAKAPEYRRLAALVNQIVSGKSPEAGR